MALVASSLAALDRHSLPVMAVKNSDCAALRSLTAGGLLPLSAPLNGGQIPMSRLRSGVEKQRSRKANWPVSLTSRAASRKPVMAAR